MKTILFLISAFALTGAVVAYSSGSDSQKSKGEDCGCYVNDQFYKEGSHECLGGNMHECVKAEGACSWKIVRDWKCGEINQK